MKLPGFHFRETMTGSWFADDGGGEQPIAFSAEARADSTLQYLRDKKARLAGEITVGGLAQARPLAGEITIDPVIGRLIRYEFTFAADDGRRIRFVGQKDVSLRDLAGSMTTLPAELHSDDGKRLGTAVLKFATRDLPSFLGSWRLDLF
jgi:hypothetical protein